MREQTLQLHVVLEEHPMSMEDDATGRRAQLSLGCAVGISAPPPLERVAVRQRGELDRSDAVGVAVRQRGELDRSTAVGVAEKGNAEGLIALPL